MKNQVIPQKSLNKTHRAQCYAIMRRGNPVLHEWHSLVAIARDLGREYTRSDFRIELFQHLNGGCRVVLLPLPGTTYAGNPRTIRIPASDVQLMCAVRDIQDTMLQGYSKMVSKIARSWSERNGNSEFPSFWDFYGEATLTMMDAIYGFTKKGTQFSTFAWSAINNRMINVWNEANPLSCWTGRDRKLREALSDARLQINGPCNFQDLLDHMGINESERIALERTFPHIVWASSITKDGSCPNREEIQDYTAQGVDIRCVSIGLPKDPEELHRKLTPTQTQIIETLQLTEFEWAVLEASYEDGKRGWQTRVAKRNINPITEKPYSRRAIWIILKRIKERLQQAHRQATGEDWEDAA